jgi:hypothetical protein
MPRQQAQCYEINSITPACLLHWKPFWQPKKSHSVFDRRRLPAARVVILNPKLVALNAKAMALSLLRGTHPCKRQGIERRRALALHAGGGQRGFELRRKLPDKRQHGLLLVGAHGSMGQTALVKRGCPAKISVAVCFMVQIERMQKAKFRPGTANDGREWALLQK